jgi:hypothetical protein
MALLLTRNCSRHTCWPCRSADKPDLMCPAGTASRWNQSRCRRCSGPRCTHKGSPRRIAGNRTHPAAASATFLCMMLRCTRKEVFLSCFMAVMLYWQLHAPPAKQRCEGSQRFMPRSTVAADCFHTNVCWHTPGRTRRCRRQMLCRWDRRSAGCRHRNSSGFGSWKVLAFQGS